MLLGRARVCSDLLVCSSVHATFTCRTGQGGRAVARCSPDTLGPSEACARGAVVPCVTVLTLTFSPKIGSTTQDHPGKIGIALRARAAPAPRREASAIRSYVRARGLPCRAIGLETGSARRAGLNCDTRTPHGGRRTRRVNSRRVMIFTPFACSPFCPSSHRSRAPL